VRRRIQGNPRVIFLGFRPVAAASFLVLKVGSPRILFKWEEIVLLRNARRQTLVGKPPQRTPAELLLHNRRWFFYDQSAGIAQPLSSWVFFLYPAEVASASENVHAPKPPTTSAAVSSGTRKPRKKKKLNRIFRYMYRVLNEVYL